MNIEIENRRCFEELKKLFDKLLKKNLNITKNKMKLSFRKWYYFQFVLGNEEVIPILKHKNKQLEFIKDQIKIDNPEKFFDDFKKSYPKCKKVQADTLKPEITKIERNKVFLKYKSIKQVVDKKTFYNLAIKNNKSKNYIEDIFILVFRYKYIGLWNDNTQLSIANYITEGLTKYLDIDNEMFASPFNSQFLNFCSMFPDIEKPFGSMGNFFNYRPEEGDIMEVNPPFDEFLIEYTVKRIIKLVQEYDDIIYILIIPVWDKIGKLILKEKYKEEFGVYEGMRIIRENDRYITNTLIFPKQHIKYQNLFTNKVIKNVSNTYMITIQSINSTKIKQSTLKKIFDFEKTKKIDDMNLVF